MLRISRIRIFSSVTLSDTLGNLGLLTIFFVKQGMPSPGRFTGQGMPFFYSSAGIGTKGMPAYNE